MRRLFDGHLHTISIEVKSGHLIIANRPIRGDVLRLICHNIKVLEDGSCECGLESCQRTNIIRHSEFRIVIPDG